MIELLCVVIFLQVVNLIYVAKCFKALNKPSKKVIEYREAKGSNILATPNGVFIETDKRDPVINSDEDLYERES